MPYIAHVGIGLRTDAEAYEKGKWYHIKAIGDIEYQWRLSHNLLYEVTAGVFSDKYEALKCAKQMYVTLIFSVLKRQIQISDAGCDFYEQRFYIAENDGDYEDYSKEEKFFFWNPHFTGGLLGPGVYEVEKFVDDFDTYKFLSATLRALAPRLLVSALSA